MKLLKIQAGRSFGEAQVIFFQTAANPACSGNPL
jgi:hypothetical protein